MRRTITPAILLMTRDMGESDLLVNLFTRDSGIVVGIAKGAKKSMKRFVNTFDMANLITAKFYRPNGRELFIIEDASLIDSFPHLSNSLNLLSYGEFTLELISQFAPEGVPQKKLFDAVSSFLTTINVIGSTNERWNGSSTGTVEGLFWSHTLKFLEELGIAPLLEKCVRCGKEFNSNKIDNITNLSYNVSNNNTHKGELDLFVPSAGGMVCNGCLLSREGGVPFSRGTIMALIKAKDVPIERLAILKFTRDSLREIRKGLMAFIRYQAGRSMKSADFIERYLKSD